MANPTPYERGYSFAGFQANNPQKPLPGQKVDGELDNIERTTAELIAGLGDIRRADGKLQNGIVTASAMSPEVSTGVQPAVEWATAIQYGVGATVFHAVAFYRALEEHVSGVFVDDFAAGKWEEYANFGPIVTGAAASAASANGAASAASDSAAAAAGSAASANTSASTAAAAAESAAGSAETAANLIGGSVTAAVRWDVSQALTGPQQFQARQNTGVTAAGDNLVTAATLAAQKSYLGIHLPRGHLSGLGLSNNATDATNDIDIAAGEARDSANAVDLVLALALTKRLDAAWVVGSGNGGLDTGSIANTTYHVHLIRRSDTGVVDALFSASATAPTLPANYDSFRRVGSILRESGAIVAFSQNGDNFTRANKQDYSSASARAAALLTLSVPTGIEVYPVMTQLLSTVTTSSTVNNSMGSAASGTANVVVGSVVLGGATGAGIDIGQIYPWFVTNTSAQIYFSVSVSGTAQNNQLTTVGWIDTRGRG